LLFLRSSAFAACDDDLEWGPFAMEIFLPLTVGAAVACVILVVGRVLVRPSSASQALPIPASLHTIDQASPVAETLLFIDHPEFVEPPKKVRRKSAAQSGETVVKAPARPRRRKSKQPNMPGSDVVQ
jgi:hypothetical protein